LKKQVCPENFDPNLAATSDKTIDGNTGGFNLIAGDPAGFDGCKPYSP
jgi:hypothetical protein